MNRLDQVARKLALKSEGQLGIVCPPSLPPFKFTLDFAEMAVQADVDMLFMPFACPETRFPWMMGPTEQKADKAALEQGITAEMYFDCIKIIRGLYPQLPVVLVSFESDVFGYGLQKFVEQSRAAGVDGIDTPGYSMVRSRDVSGLGQRLADANIHLIHPISIELALSKPGSIENELLQGLIRVSGGFVFLMADSAGKGGGQSGFPKKGLTAAAKRIKTYQHKIGKVCPLITVCGISSPDLAGAAYKDVGSDGVLVSSAIIRRLNAGESLETIKIFLQSLKNAMHKR
jgi:tryptophan synthase alpha chain